MSKKQTVKPAAKPPQSSPLPESRRRFTGMHIGAVLLVVAAVAVFVLMRSAPVQPEAQPDLRVQPHADAQTPAAPVSPPVQTAAAAPAQQPPPAAALGPHPQAKLPLLPFVSGPPARPIEVVRAVYRFAAEHPEVATYVPCYCGCERGGHRGSEDCFVAARDANGDVESWEPHGMT
jgi:hypothetical protein